MARRARWLDDDAGPRGGRQHGQPDVVLADGQDAVEQSLQVREGDATDRAGAHAVGDRAACQLRSPAHDAPLAQRLGGIGGQLRLDADDPGRPVAGP